jgi:acetoin utilization deacetylase AcuC-like enzyme
MKKTENAIAVVTQEVNCTSLPFLLNSVSGEKMECKESEKRIVEIFDGVLEVQGVQIIKPQLDEEAFLRILRDVHDTDYLNYLERSSTDLRDGESIIQHPYLPEGIPSDTPIIRGIFAQAIDAAKTAHCASLQLACGYEMSYGICRPPGHHAGKNYLGGYCYLNNAVVAVSTLQSRGFKKIAVIDIDYHFGNGTADLLVDKEDMFFCSIHASTDNDYPYHPTFERNNREKYLPIKSAPDEIEYLAFLKIALDTIKLFEAEALVVSVGYDIIAEDPHGKWQLSPEIFFKIGQQIRATQIPVCFIQEGGYAIEKLGECARNLCNGLTNLE